MSYSNRDMRGRITAFVGCCAIAVCATIASPGHAEEPRKVSGLESWSFLIGDWKLVEKRYDFDGALMQTNNGGSRFSRTMNGQRIQELQTMSRDDRSSTALHVFVYDPRSEKIEIARTDSDHYGFSILIGTMAENRINLIEKHPKPESDVTRRVTYRRKDTDNFSRQLEFSTNKGVSWFVRSEWTYTRN